ncbi:MAG TPA: hypothetical protein VH988_11825 [Thermoanaerobaculia bacterium]|jgi:hypothetical protein|nr:hypothetical protein [Thermoanaerobaculia bacterium]
MERELQVSVLATLGASEGEIDELLAYNENVFDLGLLQPETRFPLPDEPFVGFWEPLAEAARERGAWAVLREHLPQLSFPIREGISATESYRAATRRGVPVETLPEATGLALDEPESIELVLHASAAGRIPLLIARSRGAFVALIQALTKKNEPVPIPLSQGALMVSGYINWSRLRELRRSPDWREDFITERRELYQDRFILLSDGPYSAVPAADLDLDAAAWKEMSLVIRREHECAHYFTRRLFGSMRNNLLDELIADFMGITASGSFRAGWCLRFLTARLDLYRGTPPLSDGAFRVLRDLVAAAAESLERFDARHPASSSSAERALRIAALATLRLEDLASPDAEDRLAESLTLLSPAAIISVDQKSDSGNPNPRKLS